MANPYAEYLGGQDPVLVMASTPARLKELAQRLTPEQMETPRKPGKWCPREILAHLADCELAFSFRLRQVLAAPIEPSGQANSLVQPFDQTAWAARYAVYDAASALALFSAARAWNGMLLQTLTAADQARVAMHPERGEMTFRDLLEVIGGHDLNHLVQLEAVAG